MSERLEKEKDELDRKFERFEISRHEHDLGLHHIENEDAYEKRVIKDREDADADAGFKKLVTEAKEEINEYIDESFKRFKKEQNL